MAIETNPARRLITEDRFEAKFDAYDSGIASATAAAATSAANQAAEPAAAAAIALVGSELTEAKDASIAASLLVGAPAGDAVNAAVQPGGAAYGSVVAAVETEIAGEVARADAAYTPASLAVVFINHGSNASAPRGSEPGRRFWIGSVKPTAFQNGVDVLVKPIALDPATVPTSGMLARFYAQGLNLGDGATVTSWPAATGSYTLTASGAPVHKNVGGISFVETDGVDDRLDDTTLDRNQPNSIVVVGRFLAPAGGQTLVGTTTGGTSLQSIGLGTGNKRQAFAGSTVLGATTENGAWHVYIASYNGASSELMVDGAVDVSGNFGSNNADGLRIGANSGATSFFRVAVAEVIPYNRVLTTQEKADVTANLRAFYGLA